MSARHDRDVAGTARLLGRLIDTCQRLLDDNPSAAAETMRELAPLIAALNETSRHSERAVACYVLMRTALRLEGMQPRLVRMAALCVADVPCGALELPEPVAAHPLIAMIQRTLSHSSHDPNLSLARIARDVHRSKSHVEHVLKQQTGETFSYRLRRIRVHEAETLLREGTWSVKEVATKVGYRSVSTLERAFRRLNGCSPTEWSRRAATIAVLDYE